MKEKLLKSTLVVSLMTFLSRILGFVRDIVIARLLGAGMGADVFFVAFKIPNFLRRLFAELFHTYCSFHLPHWPAPF